MYVETVLSRIVFSEMDDTHYLFLKEKNGRREFPVVVGIIEACVLNRLVHKETSARPMTHHLLCSVVEKMGGVIEDVAICNMDDDTFYASMRIRRGDSLTEIDCRPTDALAVAFAHQPTLKIFVEETILETNSSTKWKYLQDG